MIWLKVKLKKRRLKLEREGKRNPELNRGTWGEFSPIERKPLHPKAEKRRKEKKHKKKWSYKGSIF